MTASGATRPAVLPGKASRPAVRETIDMVGPQALAPDAEVAAARVLPPEIHADLVETLFGTTGSFVSGLFGGLLVPIVALLRSGSTASLVCTVVTLALALFRVAVFLAHRRTPVDVRRQQALAWERAYALGGIGFMTAVGLTAAILIGGPHDEITALYGVVIVLGCAGALAGRNAGRPHIVIGQVLGVCGPVALVLMVQPQAWSLGLSFIFGLVIASVKSTTRFLNHMLVTALLSSRDSQLKSQLLGTALNSMSHGLCMTGRDGSLTVVNKRLVDFFALDDTRLPTLDSLCEAIASFGRFPATDLDAFRREIRLLAAQGSRKAFTRTVGANIYLFRCDAMANGGCVMVVEDVTEARRSAEQVERMAHFDMLTGLANRSQFHTILEDRLSEAGPGQEVALFTIDLDRFKEVNDTLGHPVGDKLLKQVALRLQNAAGPRDVVARFGGDEFQMLTWPAASPETLHAQATRLVSAISQPYSIGGQAISIGATLGIATAPRDARGADDLLKCADMALYAAKAISRGTVLHFEPALDEAMRHKRQVEQELRDGIARGELEVFYQPTVDVRTGRVSTCEALVRWRHPERGLVPPDSFIPVAEETGLIAEVGRFVLQRACRDAATWPSSIRVAVNVSAKQFLLQRDFVEQVLAVLAATGLPPSRLEIEITESTLLDAKEQLARLGAHGLRVSLDDFGTGYSSLSYLRQFAVHKIKIDRSFIKAGDAVSLAIIDAVSFLADALSVDLVVEGVETQAQLALLVQRRIYLVQGYLFSKPQPLSVLQPLISTLLKPADTPEDSPRKVA